MQAQACWVGEAYYLLQASGRARKSSESSDGSRELGLLSWMQGSDATRNSHGKASVHCVYDLEG